MVTLGAECGKFMPAIVAGVYQDDDALYMMESLAF